MRFSKQGKICDCNTFDLEWYQKNTMTPLPYFLENGLLRVYLTMCDADNKGSVGYIDVNPANPQEIVNYSKEPALGLGEKGCFDEHGVLPTSIIEYDQKLWLHYSAYQRQISYPYTIFSGLAVSSDGGNSFSRVHKTPVLDRTDDELFQRSAVEIMRIDSMFRIWYSCGSGWKDRGDKKVPCYDIHTIMSENMDCFDGKSEVCFLLKDDEYGLTMPQVFYEDGKYKMWYSVRTFSKGYRMGYAESYDGIHFERMDHLVDLSVSKSGFDNEMICFGKIYRFNGNTFMLYCGNHYGMGGLGYAKLMEE